MRFGIRGILSLLFLSSLGLQVTSWASTPSFPTNTVLTVSSPSTSRESAVTLTATVTSHGRRVHPGLVKFCDAKVAHCEDAAVLAQAQLMHCGSAMVKLILPVGTNRLKAVFQGTDRFDTSSSEEASIAVTGSYPTATGMNAYFAGSHAAGTDYDYTAWVENPGGTAFTGTFDVFDETTNTVLHSEQIEGGYEGMSVINSAVPANGEARVAADLNGDGILDQVVVKGSPLIYVGRGDGRFTQTAALTVGAPGANSFAVVSADFNNDDIPDLAIANSGDSNLYILLGRGDGTFADGIPVSMLAPSSDLNLVTGDFNGDGNADLAAISGTQMQIALGRGNGKFRTLDVQDIPVFPYQTTVADLNGDGISDLALAYGNGAAVLVGNRESVFTETASLTPACVLCSTLAIGDFNRDGKLDLVVADYGQNDATHYLPGNLKIYLGNGDGTFVFNASQFTGLHSFVNVGDFNGDGITDIATMDVDFTHLASVDIYFGAGDGTFTHSPSNYGFTGMPGPFFAHRCFATGDFNNDGKTDLPIPTMGQAEVTGIGAVVNVYPLTISGTPGAHTIYARFSGDANTPPAISDPLYLQR